MVCIRVPIAFVVVLSLLHVQTLHGVGSGRAFKGDFDAWLAAVRFDAPAGMLPSSAAYNLSNLTCTNVQVGTTTGVHPRQRDQGGLITSRDKGIMTIELRKVSIQCTIRIDYGVNFSQWADVMVQTADASLMLTARVSSPDIVEPKVPKNITFEGCQVQPRLQLTVPGGSARTKWLEWLPLINNIIASELDTAMHNQFCNQVLPQASKTLTSMLDDFYKFAHLQMSIPNPSAPPAFESTLVSWDKLPLVHWIERFQEILPQASGQLSKILNRMFPSKRACLIEPYSELMDNADPDVCLRNEHLCILGDIDDNGGKCHAEQFLHSHLKGISNLKVEVTSANLAFTNPNVTLLHGHQALLQTGFKDNSTRFSFTLNFSFAGTAGGAEIDNLWATTDFVVDFDRLDLGASVTAALDAETFFAMPSENYLKPQCVQSAIQLIKLANISSDFSMHTPVFNFSQMPQYASPTLLEGSQLLRHLVGELWRFEGALAPVLRGYLLNHSSSMIDSFVSSLSSESCPKPMGQESDNGGPPLINPSLGNIFVRIAAVLWALAILCGIVQVIRHRRHVRRNSMVGVDEDMHAIGKSTMLGPNKLHTWFADSLCMSEVVPTAISGPVPLVIIASLFLLSGANILYFAFSVVQLELGQEGTVVYEIVPYSIFYSIKALREVAHLPLLAGLLFVFSGALPYGKLVLMLLMWVLPSSVVSRTWRGRFLFLLDQIGKFSLMDIFVIQFINGSLYAEIVLPHESFDCGMSPSIAIRTAEDTGFYAFVAATVASLLIGHVCLYYHHKDPLVSLDHQCELSMEADRRHRPQLTISDLRAAKNVCEAEKVISGAERRWVGPLLVVMLVWIIFCFNVPAFTVTLFAAEQVINKSTYSLIEFATTMQTFSLDVRFGTLFGQATFIVFALSTVVLHNLVLIFLWFSGVKQYWWGSINTLLHTLAAWAALDVMLMSMVLTLVEMSTSNFMHIWGWRVQLASKLSGEPMKTEKGVRLQVTLETGTYLLAVAVLMHLCIGRLVRGMLERAVTALEDAPAEKIRKHTEWMLEEMIDQANDNEDEDDDAFSEEHGNQITSCMDTNSGQDEPMLEQIFNEPPEREPSSRSPRAYQALRGRS